MRRILFLIISILLIGYVDAQTFEATVVDANTREPLSFASVYAGRTSSTISNAVGTFSIKCDSADVLRISYVGYKPLHIRASQIGRYIGLQPMENLLKEVTVTSFDLKGFIRKTTSEMRRQLRKYEKRKADFFYRQTSFADTTCFELMEAFLQARSAVYLQDLFLLKGRYAGIQPDSLHYYSFYTNFYTMSSLPMLTRSDYQGNQEAKPFTRNFRDFYNLDYDVMGDGNNRLVAVRFIPKPEITEPILDVTLYVDEQTHRLRKMEGGMRNVRINHYDYVVEQKDSVKTMKKKLSHVFSTFNLTVNMTEERGFVEVQSVYIDEQHERYGKQFFTRSILFNTGSQKVSEGRQMWKYGDLHDYIDEQGYDQQFWHDNEIVRRTPVEQKVMELFEHQNLFGLF